MDSAVFTASCTRPAVCVHVRVHILGFCFPKDSLVSSTGYLKVLGKSVGLCKSTKRMDQLYISLLVPVWKIICENFNPNGFILAEI